MKYIIAVIQPDRLDEVLKRLEEKEIHLVTVSSVVGRGRQKGIAEVYRGHKEQGSLLRKVQIEIAVNEAFVEPAIKAIIDGARTGQIGDGKIFVLDLPECITSFLASAATLFCSSRSNPRTASLTSFGANCTDLGIVALASDIKIVISSLKRQESVPRDL